MKYGILENNKFVLIANEKEKLINMLVHFSNVSKKIIKDENGQEIEDVQITPIYKIEDIKEFQDDEVEQSYNGASYLKGYAPQQPIDELKEQKRIEINQARDQARKTEGAEYDGDIFDVDETSQSNILAQMKVAELLQDAKQTYVYRSKTNTDHLLTVSELQELGLSIAQKVNEIYAKSWTLKAEVDKATTAEQIEAIKW